MDAPADLGDLLVAVPGARAGRILLARLADAVRERGWSGFFPPRVLTQGRLVDELLALDRPSADRATRTFAWERALRAAPADVVARLVARAPAPADRAAWWPIAESLRSLHAVLAPYGLDFADVRERLGGEAGAPASELRRWDALAAVQREWRSRVDALGLADPHEGRRRALDGGQVRREARVVLVGVVDMNDLLRRALRALDEAPRVLTFAPPEAADGFDALGCLVPARWAEVEVDLPLDRWHVVDTPDEQARMAVALAAREGGATHAGDLSIGVPDDEVLPFLVRRLSASGVRARDAAGALFERTAPARLLDAVRSFVESGSASDLAALVRHPDVERATGDDGASVRRLDAFRPECLPRRFDLAAARVPDEAARRGLDLAPHLRALGQLLGPLASDAPRPLAAVATDVRELLARVYDGHPALAAAPPGEEKRRDSGRALATALELASDALDALAGVPPAMGGEVTPAAGIGLALRTAGALGSIASPPAGDDEPVVELLGWLELLLDDAPHLVVTGFNEARVPESTDGDPFLPDRVRTLLGIEDEARRVARDAYTTQALLASRERVDFVSGRRTRDGDPLFPSRLAFFQSSDAVVERIDHAVEPLSFAPVEREERVAFGDVPPIDTDPVAPETFSVTSFRQYLESPLLFHLRRVRRLEPVDDRAGELDAARFGTLTHAVLEAFGKSALCDSTDAGEIRSFVLDRLRRERQKRFADEPMPALSLQLRQLELRLSSFADWQAERAAEGWRIKEVEWEPQSDATGAPRGCAELSMPGEEPPAWIRGTIDRIEQNVETGRWAVLDYKTSRVAKDPEKVHRRVTKTEVVWKDLQLPLYSFMAEPLVGKGVVPDLGYVALTGDGTGVRCRLVGPPSDDGVGTGWDLATVEDALERARQIVRDVRAGRVTEAKSLRYLAPIEEELLGVGLVRAPERPSEDDGEGSGDDGGAA
ncbi:MAG: PD-(D/E)XK nuclease family protein [Planctomycetota bacterium]